MKERISAWMDGELDERAAGEAMESLRRDGEASDAWRSYHLISDAMRDRRGLAAGCAPRVRERLEAEPTVLAPQPKPERQIASYAWAAAAGVAAVSLVGWVAFGTLDADRPAMAKAGEAATVRAAQLKPQTVPADYLFAHQEYSPTTQIQGVGPYLRAVSASASDARP